MNPRELFFDRVYELVSLGEDIVLVTPDLAAPSLDKFRRDYPEHYVSVGVAEQNLITTASGLVLGGKKVIAWGLNPFVVTRALDQIRNTVSLMNIPLVFAGLHTGLSPAISGPTHVVITDISLIRTLDRVTTYNPSDCSLCKDIFDEVLRFERPYYLRFDKDITYDVAREETVFEDGFSMIKRGSKRAIVTTGYHTKICRDAVDEMGLNVSIIDVFRIPCDKEKLISELKQYESIISVEEHVLQGGFGSFVIECLADAGEAIRTKRIGIDMEKGYPDFFGGRAYMEKHFGLDKESIKKALQE